MRLRLVALVVLVACSSGTERGDVPVEQVRLMKAHFARAADIRDAVINGDLRRVRWSAQALHETPYRPKAPESHQAHLDDLRAIAARLSDTQSFTEASVGAAELARTCGSCHAEASIELELPDYEIPEWGDGPHRHMLRHAWAAARMWEALIGASDLRWRNGATVLAERPMDLAAYLAEVPVPPTVRELGAEIGSLASRAVQAEDAGARVRLYGAFIARCARCHREVRQLKASPAG